jgi:CRP/FNR family cyclic AMP-dependent transcriptional regulator
MEQQVPQVDHFKQKLSAVLQRDARQYRSRQVARHDNVYTCGDADHTLYFIDSGQVKLLMLSPDGHECLLAILTAGDLFGERCLAGLGERQETATAMITTHLRLIPQAQFCLLLSGEALLEGFVQYLALRIAEQQAIIANLVTVDSEQRLGKTLLHLAHKLGTPDPRSIRIAHRITHDELSAMVGTTRPRVSMFMHRFRTLGLIELSAERHLIVKEEKLAAYLERIA